MTPHTALTPVGRLCGTALSLTLVYAAGHSFPLRRLVERAFRADTAREAAAGPGECEISSAKADRGG